MADLGALSPTDSAPPQLTAVNRPATDDPMTSLESRWASLPPEKRAQLEAELARRAAQRARTTPIPRRDRTLPVPLSFSQRGLWFLDRWEPGNVAYNASLSFRLRGPLDLAVLDEAFIGLVARHEALRTVYPCGADGEPVQALLDAYDATPRRHETEDGPALDAALRHEARRRFDLEHDLLFAPVIHRLGADEHVLQIVSHHIALDNWSAAIVCRELSALYNAGLLSGGSASDTGAAELSIQYGDFAVWQRDRLQGALLQKLQSHWRSRLDGAPTLLALPLDRARPEEQRFDGARHPVEGDRAVLDAVRTAARTAGVTEYLYLFGTFAALLARWSGRTDLVVGTPVASRDRVELEPVVGLFTNTTAIRVQLDGNPRFSEVLARTTSAALGSFAHAELPFEKIVEAVKPPRSLAHNPVFQVNFRVAPPNPPRLDLDHIDVSTIPVDVGYAKFDLAMELHLGDHGIGGYLEYDRALFLPETIASLASAFVRLLTDVANEPAVRLLSLGAPEPALSTSTESGSSPIRRRGAVIPSREASP